MSRSCSGRVHVIRSSCEYKVYHNLPEAMLWAGLVLFLVLMSGVGDCVASLKDHGTAEDTFAALNVNGRGWPRDAWFSGHDDK